MYNLVNLFQSWKILLLLKFLWRFLSLYKTFSSLSSVCLEKSDRNCMKAVSSPTVHIGQSVTEIDTSICAENLEMVSVSSTQYTEMLNDACHWIRNSHLPYVEQFLIILLLRNGLRVSDICNPSNIRIIDKYHVYVYNQIK